MKKDKNGQLKINRKFQIISKNAPFQYQEAYKSLRTNLKFVSLNGDYKKLVITSAIPGDGKSTVAVNLAVSMAEAGTRVLLVDCDMRKPILHKYLRISKNTSAGLTGVLSGAAKLEDAIVRFSDIGIHVLTAGVIPPNPAELLGGAKMKALIEEMESMYDYDSVRYTACFCCYRCGCIKPVRRRRNYGYPPKTCYNRASAVGKAQPGNRKCQFDWCGYE